MLILNEEDVMTPKVYLADLRYDYCGVLASDCMPLGVSYLKAVIDRDVPEVQSRLFAYPDKLWQAMQAEPPDVLMVSNYMWCEQLSLRFARLAKALNPNALVVMGGPNIPIEDERQKQYLAGFPELDLYVLGEGDFLGAEVVKHYLDTGMSVKKMGSRTIPSSVYRGPDGEVVLQSMWDRHREIDDIPSPWLTGILDEFFDGKLVPMMETNRGCPFTCTFCVQGTRWYTKVHYFSQERIKEELDYIAAKVHEKSPHVGTLRIADSNYGMFERDIDISAHIGKLQKQYSWPTLIDATTGKNRPERIIQSLEQVSGALVLYQAVQSLDEDVLRKVKRQSIKVQAYEQLQVHVRGRGLRSNSDLILALPGETLDTHVKAIHKLADAGVDQVSTFQLLLLKGSELETDESRRTFQMEHKFRISPKTFGEYGGEKVFDIEEIVVATDTLPFEDYLNCRVYALGCAGFWHDNNFEDVLRFAEQQGVKRSEWLDRLIVDLQAINDGPLHAYVQNFVNETRGELFDTPQECIEFYSREENFQRLMSSEIGDNLVRKYQAIASLFVWPELCELVLSSTKQLVIDKQSGNFIAGLDDFWASFAVYTRNKHAHGHTEQEILSNSSAVLNYDVDRWVADGMPLEFGRYALAEAEEFEFCMTEDGIAGLSGAIRVYGAELKGLIRMMKRIRVNWLTRECRRTGAELMISAHGISTRAVAAGD
jgi:radical SAM superfamily enzyme YgiQ (UPF0313 family)